MGELAVSDIARSNRGTSAHRSGYTPLMMSEDDLAELNPKQAEDQAQQEAEELSVLAKIAALKDHPGYKQMRELRLKTINHYRSGEFAKALLTDGSITDEEFGKKMRVGMLVADELEKELNTVELADKVIEQEKVKPDAARQRPKRD